MGRPPEQRRGAAQRSISLGPSTTTSTLAHAGQGVWEAADREPPTYEGPHNTVHQATEGRRDC
jgi:hypothetical protein